MPFLVGADLPDRPAGERFRSLLSRPQILQIPGAHTGMAAHLARFAGVAPGFVGGRPPTGALGIPGPRLISGQEVLLFNPPGAARPCSRQANSKGWATAW